ncbi:hypothetical protein CLOSTMETH_02983 [[Clostridium] methylpentosum DSM 5476]|uniref:Uncharacterized protein n=1 Tax=[Clostridium] methylpentosum DSM 5476 TaxID=537013 RepID=C0EGJ0_9FIRM|nr:hypothetical protein CLOSTMETH_02983 [[Clostridium] methylpentosum DSM 5476]
MTIDILRPIDNLRLIFKNAMKQIGLFSSQHGSNEKSIFLQEILRQITCSF